MTETDKQFVERIWERVVSRSGLSLEDDARLYDLALRGAETQWRPISEYDNNDYAGGVMARMEGGKRRWLDRIALCDRRDFTHFIPVTALGSRSHE